MAGMMDMEEGLSKMQEKQKKSKRARSARSIGLYLIIIRGENRSMIIQKEY